MKNLVLVLVSLFTTTLLVAQNTEPILTEINSKTSNVKFYHDNGKIMHEGNYIDGKASGIWKSYDEDGKLIAEGTFENGKKVGLWNFYSNDIHSEVIYNNNTIAEVNKFTRNGLVKK